MLTLWFCSVTGQSQVQSLLLSVSAEVSLSKENTNVSLFTLTWQRPLARNYNSCPSDALWYFIATKTRSWLWYRKAATTNQEYLCLRPKNNLTTARTSLFRQKQMCWMRVSLFVSTKHDIFRTLTKWFLCLKLTRPQTALSQHQIENRNLKKH